MPSEYVMRGNAAILKCSIPSFVADFVYVTAWIDEEGHEILPSEDKTTESVLKTLKIKQNFPFFLFLFMIFC